MNQMPTTRALFGYDVIGSSSADDDLLDEVRELATNFVHEALGHVGIDTQGRVNYSPTGDGSLAVYPESDLPALIDAAYFLQGKLYLHNRTHRPAIKLRLSVHTAPIQVTQDDNFQRPTIELARLLDAAAFKQIVLRMARYRPVTVGLVVSDQAYRVAVKGQHTQRLLLHDFGEVEVANKEFSERCWVWAPGLDAERIRELSQQDQAADRDEQTPSAEPITSSAEQSASGVTTTVNGNMRGNNFIGPNSGTITAHYQQPGMHQ